MIPATSASPTFHRDGYAIDPVHSCVQFRVRHLGFSRVTGRFDRFTGRFMLNPVSLGSLQVEARIEAASVNTGDAERDRHLRSSDFLDVGQFPEIVFRSTKVSALRVDTFTLTGELVLHGVRKQVDLDVTYLGEATDQQGRERVAFEARTRLNRHDFGLTWNSVLETGGLLLGDEVDILIEVQAVREQP
ncbi:MAG: hypothetical protein KatS3mg044_1427 [Rhodothermaceae bacterium]|nr:MAG: hypothetical protein KatS3mg044_1427 [Rhodothermaceae bacterium]